MRKLPLYIFSFVSAVLLFIPLNAGWAQSTTDISSQTSTSETSESATLALTLEDAISIALRENYDRREAELAVRDAESQVREAWGQVLPQVDVSSSYTRDIVSANPFAGSDALRMLGGGDLSDWVAFNERARLDDDPTTQPITYDEFIQRQRQAQEQAGLDLSDPGNPFGVDNQIQTGITLSQPLYNATAFAAIRGARQLEEINQRSLDRQEQLIIQEVKEQFYTALLTQQQAMVAIQSVERTQETLRDVRQQVDRGVVPMFERTTTEVQLSNLETELVQAENQVGTAIDNLKMTLGLPMDQQIMVRGSLEDVDHGRLQQISAEEAIDTALRNRPDLRQSELAIELREIDRNITRSNYVPQVSAFASFDYLGRIPDDRTQTITDPLDPFYFDTEEQGFFSSEYWNADISAGIQLSWNIFDGFQTSEQVAQREIAINEAQINQQRVRESIKMEVQRAMRNLEAARQRIRSQERNIDRAETNYQHAAQRVQEGVSSRFELREASNQLDQSRLNYYQAVHDFLAAQSALRTAMGIPLEQDEAIQLTGR